MSLWALGYPTVPQLLKVNLILGWYKRLGFLGSPFSKAVMDVSPCILGWIPKQCEFTHFELCCNGPAFVAWGKWMFIFHFAFLNMEDTYFHALLLGMEESLKRIMLNCLNCQIQCNVSYLCSLVRYCHL